MPSMTPQEQQDFQTRERVYRATRKFMADNNITDARAGWQAFQDRALRTAAIREITTFQRRLAQHPQAQQELAQIHAMGRAPALLNALASLDETGKPYLSADALRIVESTLAANGDQLAALVQKVEEHAVMEIVQEHEAIIQEAVEKAEPGSPESDPEIQALALRAAIEKGAKVERGQSPYEVVKREVLDPTSELNASRIYRDENGKAVVEQKWSDEEVNAGSAAVLREKQETIQRLRTVMGDKAAEKGMRQRFAERDAKNRIDVDPEAAARLDRDAVARSKNEQAFDDLGLERLYGETTGKKQRTSPAQEAAREQQQADRDWKPHSRPSTLREKLDQGYDAIDQGTERPEAQPEPAGNSRRAALEDAYDELDAEEAA